MSVNTERDRWTRKDVWLGVLFVVFGLLIVLYAVAAMRRDLPVTWWGMAWLVGPVLLFLGVNGVVRSLRAGPSEPPPESR